MASKYNHKKIEKKWQDSWEKSGTFHSEMSSKKEKYYVLDMFPYPSGKGLHMGHAFVFSLGDIYARFKRLQGFNVLYPMGYDSFGLPAENAAIKEGVHPEEYTKKAMANFMKQQKAMGWSYDWRRKVMSHDPNFYKWDQWIFLKMLEKGVAFRKKAPVNWCPKCETVLANEQVVNGKCWRHEDTDVEIKQLEQWFLKTTKYADEFIEGLDDLDWPETAKVLQKNWIGKSEGMEIEFKISHGDFPDKDIGSWKIFTTRPDTIYGVTFMVVSAQHSRLMELVTDENENNVKKFLKKIGSVSRKSMNEAEDLEKEGVFTGSYAINPLTKEKVPIYAGNFVVADYGSGMVMAVPGHDQRDFEFAKKYGIEIKKVIDGEVTKDRAYTGEGKLVNSGEFDGINSKEAIKKISDHIVKKKFGKKVFQYRLRDWLISRQRYWGTPIPVVYCDKCGIVPVNEKDLPIKLPIDVEFGKGNPLKTNKKFLETKCPKCSGNAKRETDTMDTFANSSWYYLRYTDNENNKEIFDKKKANYWAPVDFYIGGPEHITMHLIYVRFYCKFLRDIGLLNFGEPANRYFTQGIVHGSDGEKMSKSRGNIVEPLDSIEKYGADSLRLYLFSNASPESDSSWDSKGIDNTYRFVQRVYDFCSNVKLGKSSERVSHKINSKVKEIEDYVGRVKYNLAIIDLRRIFESIQDEKEISKEDLEKFVKMFSIFCPFVSEEIWEKIGGKGFISLANWPEVDKSKISESIDKQDKAFEKIVEDINNISGMIKDKSGQDVKNVYVYALPNEVNFYDEKTLSKKVGLQVKVYAVNDPKKKDPEGKSKKAKPGKPGIYME